MKDNKYIGRFMATAMLLAIAYGNYSRITQVASEPLVRPNIMLTTGDEIDPSTAPVTTKFEEKTAKEFIQEVFGDAEGAPDLNEFLSRFTCSSCGKRCLLASPSCFVGNGRQESAVGIYQEMYPEVEI